MGSVGRTFTGSRNSIMQKSFVLYVFIALAMSFSGCEATQSVMFTSLEPAPVVLSKEIKRIGIIDESITLQ